MIHGSASGVLEKADTNSMKTTQNTQQPAGERLHRKREWEAACTGVAFVDVIQALVQSALGRGHVRNGCGVHALAHSAPHPHIIRTGTSTNQYRQIDECK